VINRQHVITHQGLYELIGGPLGRILVGANHQQIDIREAIPIALGKRSEQPDAAIVCPHGVPQALAQRRDPPIPLAATQWCEGALTGGH
jgi:hypothetical protein